MRRELLRRVRWGNVAFAIAVLIVLVTGVRAVLGTAAPLRLPSDRAVPLISGDPRPPPLHEPAAREKAKTANPRRDARPARRPRGRSSARARRRPARSRQRKHAPRPGRGRARPRPRAAPAPHRTYAPRPAH